MEKQTIFYFEDNLESQKHFGSFLTNQGYALAAFSVYEDAIKAATDPQRVSPDIAVIDLHDEVHGDNAGLDIIKTLRKQHGNKLPIVVLSNYEDPFHRKKALQALANNYVSKGEAEDKDFLLQMIETMVLLNKEDIENDTLVIGKLKHYLDSNEYEWKGQLVKLQPKQKQVLYCLICDAPNVQKFDVIRKFASLKRVTLDAAIERLDFELERIESMQERIDLSDDEKKKLGKKHQQYYSWSRNDPEAYAKKLDQNLISRHITSIRDAFQAVDEEKFTRIRNEHGEGYSWVIDR